MDRVLLRGLGWGLVVAVAVLSGCTDISTPKVASPPETAHDDRDSDAAGCTEGACPDNASCVGGVCREEEGVRPTFDPGGLPRPTYEGTPGQVADRSTTNARGPGLTGRFTVGGRELRPDPSSEIRDYRLSGRFRGGSHEVRNSRYTLIGGF